MNRKNFKTLIIMCWVVLFVTVIIKLFGGNWFELSTENTKFIKFCNYVDNTMWLKMTLACFNYLLTGYFVISMLLNKEKLDNKTLIIFAPIMIFKSIISWYILWLAYILDAFVLIIIPLIFKKFKNWKRVIIINILILLLQLLTLLTRNLSIGFGFNENSTLLSMLYQIDYVIMIFLSYIYNVKYFIRKEK